MPPLRIAGQSQNLGRVDSLAQSLGPLVFGQKRFKQVANRGIGMGCGRGNHLILNRLGNDLLAQCPGQLQCRIRRGQEFGNLFRPLVGALFGPGRSLLGSLLDGCFFVGGVWHVAAVLLGDGERQPAVLVIGLGGFGRDRRGFIQFDQPL